MSDPIPNPPIGELGDRELARIVLVGTFIGLPLVFAVSTILALRVGVVNALAISVLPTLFSGSFVGGLILLMRALLRAERTAARPVGSITSRSSSGST